MNRSTQSRGVTLIELMVAVAIVGILAAIGYPSYQGYMYKTRRADCKEALDEVAYQLHRCRGTYGSYIDAGCNALDNPVTSDEGHYEVDFAVLPNPNPTANSFTIQCSHDADGLQVGDDQCATMSVDESGVTQARDAGGNLNTALCW